MYAASAQAQNDFELISIALEHTGADAARPYVERAGTTFTSLVDEQGVTAEAFDFKAVPNGVLVDADGTIRWAKFGGFSVGNPEDRAVVERFAAGEDPGPSPAQETPYGLGALERNLIGTKLRFGRLLDSLGRREEAIREWQDALHLDPANLTIRKQIWAARFPEKFFPTIDWEWQQVQLAQERQQELAAGFCGPDGCPLPQR